MRILLIITFYLGVSSLHAGHTHPQIIVVEAEYPTKNYVVERQDPFELLIYNTGELKLSNGDLVFFCPENIKAIRKNLNEARRQKKYVDVFEKEKLVFITEENLPPPQYVPFHSSNIMLRYDKEFISRRKHYYLKYTGHIEVEIYYENLAVALSGYIEKAKKDRKMIFINTIALENRKKQGYLKELGIGYFILEDNPQ